MEVYNSLEDFVYYNFSFPPDNYEEKFRLTSSGFINYIACYYYNNEKHYTKTLLSTHWLDIEPKVISLKGLEYLVTEEDDLVKLELI